jgi:hypothetical protein
MFGMKAIRCHVYILSVVTFIVILLSGCVITRDIEPVNKNTKIDKIYIIENPRVHMSGLLPCIEEKLTDMGFATEVIHNKKDVPPNSYSMAYTANWAWDLAMYLTYFRIELMYNNQGMALVCYDATKGGGRLDKFGKTSEIVNPLLEQLLSNARPSK